MVTPFSFWLAFNAAVVVLLVLDLTVLNRKARAPSLLESIVTTLVWVTLAVGFGCWLTWQEGTTKGSEFFTGFRSRPISSGDYSSGASWGRSSCAAS
jgi:tellurite resistance protein TerC